MQTKSLIQHIAQSVQARLNCIQSGNSFAERWEERLEHIERNYLPSGSGIDNGTRIDLNKSTGERIVLTFGFHHMDDNGFYCGWTDHTAIVTPAFDGFNLRITGQNKRDVKDYLADLFHHCLSDRNNAPSMAIA